MIKWLLPCAALILLCAVGCVAQDAGPRTLAEYWGNLDGNWRFQTDPAETGEVQGWQNVDFDDAGWRELRVPGYWEPQGITMPRPGRPPTPKGRMPWSDYDGAAWYRLRFVVPADWVGGDLVLRLGSVDDYDTTYLNGALVGETGQGAERAVLLLRSYAVQQEIVRFGEENVLAIRVVDGGGPGGLMGPAITLLPRHIAEERMMLPQDDRPLAQRFEDPPASARILKIVHSQPDKPDQQDEAIRSLISQGFGGMATNVSFDGYVESEEKWVAFLSAVRKAKESGMSLWLYDELGYPSGTAGGITMRDHPEWEAQGLFVADALSDGGQVSIELPPGELRIAAAYPVREGNVDLNAAVDLEANVADGKLTWTAPEGQWHVMAITRDRLYEGTHAAVSLHENKPYVNLLMAEPTKKFLEVTHDAYAERLGEDLGEWFVATFTDEPSLMSRFFRRMPYRPLPWSPGFSDEFKQRRGYDIEPLIPLLVAEGGDSPKTRYDFWLTVGELVSENFFGQIQDWCRAHGFASGGHLLLEEPLADHVPFYGDLMECTRRLDAPSIDCLTSIPAQVPWRVARMVSSCGELNGTAVTMCETSDHSQRYRPQGDTRPMQIVTEEEIRGTCNRLILSGINTITSYYSFAELSTEQMRRINEWIGRCCTMLRGGHQVTDIAVLYPIHSAWPTFRPAHVGATDSPETLAVQDSFNSATDSLFRTQRDFTFIDAETLAGGQVEDGQLKHRELAWRVVVLPCADTLPLAAWENLLEFWRSGGVVVSLTRLPANSETQFPSEDVAKIAGEMFREGSGPGVSVNDAGGVGIYLPTGSEGLLPVVLDSVIAPDMPTDRADAPLRMTHRRIGDDEVYFIINDSGKACEATVGFAAEGDGKKWDPATGTTEPVADPSAVKLSLEPYGGMLFTFDRTVQPQRKTVEAGELPGMATSPLPVVEPGPGKGEFVQANVEPAKDGDGWRVRGTITKSDVDTFLFLGFGYADGLDLSGAHSLVVESMVPEGQKTPARLLVIVRDRDGADYMVDTGRALSAPGRQTRFVPLSSLHLAGWSKDPDGELDLDGIEHISIGWGGYFGEEGETVEFTLRPPKVARLGK